MKPLIGITVFNELRDRGRKYNALNFAYVDAVKMAGGIPIMIPVLEDSDGFEYINRLDGILFSGGEDMSPLYFGEEPIRELGQVDSRRDENERKLFLAAKEKKMPILGICRGSQVLNVYMGGTLYQDIDSQVKGVQGHHPTTTLYDERYHMIDIVEGTTLYDIFKTKELGINSFHHQAVKELAPNLVATAHAKDGIIEAWENKNMEEHYILATQWHPEAMIHRHREFLKIFENFIERVKREVK